MSGDKSVTETKPDQNNVSREKQGVKRRRQREYRLYVHRGLDGRIHSLSTSPPDGDWRILVGIVVIVLAIVLMFLTIFG